MLAEDDVVQPDVLYVSAEHLHRVGERYITGPVDLAIEVSSPSGGRLEVLRKRELYERYGIPEYWYVDLELDTVEVYRLEAGRYGTPQLLSRGDRLTSALLPSFALDIGELLGPSET